MHRRSPGGFAAATSAAEIEVDRTATVARKVEILNLSNEFQVAVISNEKFLTLDNAKNDAGFTTTYRDDAFFVDPRNKKL